jgi:hypothetical protein
MRVATKRLREVHSYLNDPPIHAILFTHYFRELGGEYHDGANDMLKVHVTAAATSLESAISTRRVPRGRGKPAKRPPNTRQQC